MAAASTLLCLAPAWLLGRHDFRGKKWLRAVFTLPMAFSGIIIGFLTVIMLGRIGVLPRLLDALTGADWLYGASYGFGGILVAYLYFEIPRATLTLESAVQKLDPRWESAAATLGASPWQRFRLVTLPLVLPALLSTFAVTFSVSLGSFGVVLILSRRFSAHAHADLRGGLCAFQLRGRRSDVGRAHRHRPHGERHRPRVRRPSAIPASPLTPSR